MTVREPIVLRVDGEAFDDPAFPLGIVRIAFPDQTVRYFNRALDEMTRAAMQVDAPITDLALSARSRGALQAALKVRFDDRRGNGYTLDVRNADGTSVRAQVAAVPEYDADGKLMGSIGFIANRSREIAASAIYRAMERARQPKALLREVTHRLRDVLQFDALMITFISKDGRHLRVFEEPSSRRGYRWWPMPVFVRRMLQAFEPGPLDLDAMFREPDYARLGQTDEATKQFRRRRFRHALRLSVGNDGRRVAVVTLLRRGAQAPAFTAADLALCNQLPLAGAVNAAMAIEARLNHRFTVQLVQGLSRLECAQQVAQHLVDSLQRHFRWPHVSLFRVDEVGGRLRLLCQASHQWLRLPDGYDQPIGVGVLGRSQRLGRPVNVPDVNKCAFYLRGVEGIGSELVMPLPGRRVQWLLNVESSQRDAFARDEQDAIDVVLRVAAFALDRAEAITVQHAVLAQVADGVVQTDADDTIRDVNPAFAQMIGMAREQLLNRSFISLLPVQPCDNASATPAAEPLGAWQCAPPGMALLQRPASELVFSEKRGSQVVRLVRSDRSTVPMLVSVAPLPSALRGKVLVASDLSGKQYLDRAAKLLDVFQSLAGEMRVPLASASMMARRVEREADVVRQRELLVRIREQLVQADGWAMRVMRAAEATERSDGRTSHFVLGDAARAALAELALGQAVELRVREPIRVVGQFDDLKFCIRSLLTQLYEAPGARGLFMALGRDGTTHGFVELGQSSAPQRATPNGDPVKAVQLELVVPHVMERMRGRCEAPTAPGQPYRLLVALAEAA